MELSNRESRSSWTTFVEGLKSRGLSEVEFFVSDDHAGLLPPRFAGLRGALRLQPVRRRRQEHPAPRFELMRGHLGLTGDDIHRVAPQESQHDVGLARRAPACRDFGGPPRLPALLVFSLISILLDDRLTSG